MIQIGRKTPTVPSRYSGGRFLLVDGLRGVASFAVVLYHFRDALNQTASAWIAPQVEALFAYGYLGVDIFFVISGFVIPFSVRNATHTPGFLFRFAVRRSIRLDPPYWITIALQLLAIKLGLLLFPSLDTPFPTIEKILAHLIYAQEILGFGSIVAIFWTLCYEVQFYLFFVGSLVILRSVRHRFKSMHLDKIVVVLSGLFFLWSVTVFFGPRETPIHGLFLDRWYQFFLGFLAIRCFLLQRLTASFLTASLVVLSASMMYFEHGADNGLAALAIAWLLAIAGLRSKMEVWLAGSIPLFLGRVSYSLYLIHPVIGWRIIKLLHELKGDDFTLFEAWIALGCGVASSVTAAWLMWRLIEAPSLRLCHRIRMDRPLTVAEIRRSRPASRVPLDRKS